jgi:hypothetical protein
MPILTTIAELPPTGILGLCVHLATITHRDEEDPVECLIRALSEGGINFSCFPGSHSREVDRMKERLSDDSCISIHRFLFRFPNPPSN